jgi:hypothetical protein
MQKIVADIFAQDPADKETQLTLADRWRSEPERGGINPEEGCRPGSELARLRFRQAELTRWTSTSDAP